MNIIFCGSACIGNLKTHYQAQRINLTGNLIIKDLENPINNIIIPKKYVLTFNPEFCYYAIDDAADLGKLKFIRIG